LRDVEQLHSLMLALEAESDVAALERYREKPPIRSIMS
jgi:hypothetical protein